MGHLGRVAARWLWGSVERQAGWAVAGLALVPRLTTVAAGFQTTDEHRWMVRSWRFQDSLLHGNLSGASARGEGVTTMPGVTTMWIGGVARVVWTAGRELGLWAQGTGEQFVTSRSALMVAQATMAVVVAAVVGLITLLVARWSGVGAAVVAGILLASEPFLVAHGAVLHTDELSSLLGVGSLVATALVLGLPGPTPWSGRVGIAVLAGALWGASWLTKVSAVMFLPSMVLLAGWGMVAAWRRWPDPGDRRQETAGLVRQGAWWVGAAAATIVVSYPALWVGPLRELRAIRRSASLVGESHLNFFRGEVTETPGAAFYLVALPLRMTPWFLVGTLAATVVVAWRRDRRGLGLALVVMAVPSFVVLSLAAKQFDRYGLPVLTVAAILVGVALGPALAAWWSNRTAAARSRWVPALAVGAVLAVSVHSLVVAPWGLGYYSPALGGAETAQDTVLVGWGEGLDDAAGIIDRASRGRCDEMTVWVPRPLRCGSQATLTGPGGPPDYVVIYVTDRQRMPEPVRDRLTEGRSRVGTVEHHGILYLEVFGPIADEPGAGDAAA